jgi:hypothetical protein
MCVSDGGSIEAGIAGMEAGNDVVPAWAVSQRPTARSRRMRVGLSRGAERAA